MKVKSDKNAEGFEYAGIIQPLENPSPNLPSEPSKIQIQWNYPGSECGHMTTPTLCIPEQRAFLAFDLLYNRINAWCGLDIDKTEMRNFKRLMRFDREQTMVTGLFSHWNDRKPAMKDA